MLPSNTHIITKRTQYRCINSHRQQTQCNHVHVITASSGTLPNDYIPISPFALWIKDTWISCRSAEKIRASLFITKVCKYLKKKYGLSQLLSNSIDSQRYSQWFQHLSHTSWYFTIIFNKNDCLSGNYHSGLHTYTPATKDHKHNWHMIILWVAHDTKNHQS